MLANRLVDGLYVEAMVLADEVRSYFDAAGRDARDDLDPMTRVLFSCESLKVTTRLMHVIAWLLTQRAVEVGEIPALAARSPSRRLTGAVETDAATLARLPAEAQRFVTASIDLYRRVALLDAGSDDQPIPTSPVRGLMHRLQQAF